VMLPPLEFPVFIIASFLLLRNCVHLLRAANCRLNFVFHRGSIVKVYSDCPESENVNLRNSGSYVFG
jgi:hypothetical protein